MWYTRGGDKGTTALYGRAQRVRKTELVIGALGALDELVSFVGLARAKASVSEKKILLDIQQTLFIIQAQVAGANKPLGEEKVKAVEAVVDAIEESLPPVTTFLIPGETEQGALYDVCRTVSRRVERELLAWGEAGGKLASASQSYLNRLSSLFYALARQESMRSGAREVPPGYGR